MRAIDAAVSTMILAAAPALGAQTSASPTPTLVLTIFGGALTGHSLWNVNSQSICVLSGATCSPQDDTLRLTRTVGASITLGFAGSYYPRSTIGFHGEIVYLALPLDDTCTAATFQDDRNTDLCDNVTAANGGGSAIGVVGSVSARLAPGSRVSPYVRIGGGVLGYTSSTTEVAGSYFDPDGSAFRSREIIGDQNDGGGTSAGLFLALGLTSALGPGYQVRLELRDLYSGFSTVTGPATRQGLGASTARKYFHHIGLILGLDIVLEKKRGRRY